MDEHISTLEFSPGTLVRARSREWVVQPSPESGVLYLRPLGGTDDDIQVILSELEATPVQSATFPPPDSAKPGSYSSALLLRDALRLKLRSGAGPFRSFGHIAVEPRAYQLVPLLMALKMDTVRLLIADDVGIGKTIEAGLIVRELLDRAEIQRFAVLCPPHLVDQWQSELSERFHIQTAAVTSASVSRLEREVPPGVSLFEHFPAVVVSLDYIKNERHRENFLSLSPEFIIIDEAHTCTMAGQGRQLRFELLKRLSADTSRHMVMLTATPHSGNDSAFHNLLSLLKPEFATLEGETLNADNPLRQDLALHFVQRRRIDINEWQDNSVFPKRLVKEITYSLTGEWGRFFESVRSYCLGLAQKAESEKGESARMMWYATLALLRCVASSPAAAHSALTTRLTGSAEEMEALADEERIDDASGEDLISSDHEPPAALEESALLTALIAQADTLRGTQGDPKLAVLVKHIETLIKEKFRPVIFCRYIATATYVAEQLKARFPQASVDCITGLLTPEQRDERVALMTAEEQPILVATDCLSEGINLQEGFNAVIHYDLAWNPTRHEQREGRVDRFGQKSAEVRCTMLYGQDNPVDGFILNVILSKAEAIRQELGVLVPIPDDDKRIRMAVVKAALMKSKNTAGSQGAFDFGDDEFVKTLESQWQDAKEKTRANRTVFAQRRLKPEEVIPEWKKQMRALGDPKDVERFTTEALIRLHSPLEKAKGKSYTFHSDNLPAALKERLAAESIAKKYPLSFEYPAESGTRFVHRSHQIVSLLAEYLLENALSGQSLVASRCGAFESSAVKYVTTIFLLRARHQIHSDIRGKRKELMAEESLAIAVQGRSDPVFLEDEEVERLLDAHPEGNLDAQAISREVQKSIDWYQSNIAAFERLVQARAEVLLDDHVRVRKASFAKGSTRVQSCLPPDLIGVYVLLPDTL